LQITFSEANSTANLNHAILVGKIYGNKYCVTELHNQVSTENQFIPALQTRKSS